MSYDCSLEQYLDYVEEQETRWEILDALERLERRYSLSFMPTKIWQEYLALVQLAHGPSMALWAWRKRRPEMSLHGLECWLRGWPVLCPKCGQASCVCPLPF
jgi:hypothetical protein